jgi:thiamine biosynthesis lipoprotein
MKTFVRLTFSLAVLPLTLATALLTAAPNAADWPLVQRDVYLMGTRALLATYAADRPSGQAILESALDVLEDTEAQLSTWRDDSAISRLNRAAIDAPWHADASLCRLFADLYEWQERTMGAFDPAVGALAGAWRIHDDGQVPTLAQLDAARARTGLKLVDFDRQGCTLVRRAEATVDVGAFGKGEALDRVAAMLAGRAWIVDLGGQVAVGGTPPGGTPWVIDVAHPQNRDRPVMQVEMRSGSLSTSAGSERDVYVGDVRIGHILDPRSGKPAAFTGSVVVWHERALIADIVSTARYVMGPAEGLTWAEARGIAAAYLIPSSYGVATAATAAFTSRLKPTAPG